MSIASISTNFGPIPTDIVGWQAGDQVKTVFPVRGPDIQAQIDTETYYKTVFQGTDSTVQTFDLIDFTDTASSVDNVGPLSSSNEQDTTLAISGSAVGGLDYSVFRTSAQITDRTTPLPGGSEHLHYTLVPYIEFHLNPGFGAPGNKSLIIHYVSHTLDQSQATFPDSDGNFHSLEYTLDQTFYVMIVPASVPVVANIHSPQDIVNAAIPSVQGQAAPAGGRIAPDSPLYGEINNGAATIIGGGQLALGRWLGDAIFRRGYYSNPMAAVMAARFNGSFNPLAQAYDSSFQAAGRLGTVAGTFVAAATAGFQAQQDYQTHGAFTSESGAAAANFVAAVGTGFVGNVIGGGVTLFVGGVSAVGAAGLAPAVFGMVVAGASAYALNSVAGEYIDVAFGVSTPSSYGRIASFLYNAGSTFSSQTPSGGAGQLSSTAEAPADVSPSSLIDPGLSIGETAPAPHWVYNLDTGQFGWQDAATAGQLDRVLTQLDLTPTPIALNLQGDQNGQPTDDVITGGALGDHLSGLAGNDVILGLAGDDTLIGGAGIDILSGNSGHDTFVFDQAALSDARASTAIFDHVTDYDQGNNGSYSVAEGDQVDLSALLSTAYNHGSGQAVGSLVRAVANGTDVNLQIDTDGSVNGANWITIAQLDGLQAGQTVNAILDSSLPAGSNITAVRPRVAGDFNGSSMSEVLWYNHSSGDVGYWSVNGSSAQWSGVGTGSNTVKAVGVGDFNGNGIADVLWQNPANNLMGTWLMTNGQPTWQLIDVGSTTMNIAGIGDFNGDHASDILWLNPTNNLVGEWQMNNAHDTWALVDQGSTTMNIAGIGDFNGDGKSDVLWLNPTNNLVGYWAMNGAIDTWHLIDQGSTTMNIVGVGDFNGNGTDDVLWENPTNGTVGFWGMSNGQATSWNVVGTASTAYQVAAIGDYDGNGTSDILWRNAATGDTGIWAMNNGQATWHDLGMSSTSFNTVKP